jgi:hypothetical protein
MVGFNDNKHDGQVQTSGQGAQNTARIRGKQLSHQQKGNYPKAYRKPSHKYNQAGQRQEANVKNNEKLARAWSKFNSGTHPQQVFPIEFR